MSRTWCLLLLWILQVILLKISHESIGEFGVGHPGTKLRDLFECNDGKLILPLIQLIQQTAERAMVLSGPGCFGLEYFAKKLYDDLNEKEEEYLLLLEPLENSIWTEKICGILGTLATIYR